MCYIGCFPRNTFHELSIFIISTEINILKKTRKQISTINLTRRLQRAIYQAMFEQLKGFFISLLIASITISSGLLASRVVSTPLLTFTTVNITHTRPEKLSTFISLLPSLLSFISDKHQLINIDLQ